MSLKFIIPSENEDKHVVYEGEYIDAHTFRVTVPIGEQVTQTDYEAKYVHINFSTNRWVPLQ